MAVIEAGADEAAFQINGLIRLECQNFFVGTYGSKLAIFYQKSLLQWQTAGVNLAVDVRNLHGNPSFFLILSDYSPGCKGFLLSVGCQRKKTLV